MNGVRRFRKKPVAIEAIQWDGSAAQATVVIDWILSSDKLASLRYEPIATYRCIKLVDGECTGVPEDHVIRIRTLEGDMDARPGWWVIRGVKGEFYPCEPEIFEGSYDPEDANR